MNAEFKVLKVAGRIQIKENNRVKETSLDLGNVLYCLSINPENHFLRMIYAILVSGKTCGVIGENYIVS